MLNKNRPSIGLPNSITSLRLETLNDLSGLIHASRVQSVVVVAVEDIEIKT
jgi:hypothetical protein